MSKKRVRTTLTVPYLRALDHLVEEGLYLDHQATIREALRRLFRYHGVEPFLKSIEETEKS